jgi:hypothetical protein
MTEPTALDEFLAWLTLWSAAYPEDIFPPIDMREVEDRAYSGREVSNIASRNAAGMARHILGRVTEQAEKLRSAT